MRFSKMGQVESLEFQKRLNEALEFIHTHDFSNEEEGRHDVNENFYYLVQRYQTKEKADAAFETHKKYADIQYIVEGREAIGYCNIAQIEALATMDYNEEKDVRKYSDPKEYNVVILNGGEYAVFLPEDAHKPSYHPDGEEPSTIFKIVGKVKI